MAICYIAKTPDYWLRVKLESNEIISVPYGLKLERLEIKAGREYFKILEGVYKGKKASVSMPPGGSYLTDKIKHQSGILLKFDRKSQSLHVGGAGPFNAFSGGGHSGYTPVSAGTYLLAIPAYPSAQTRAAYNHWCTYHNLWFRIGIETTGSRFLHAGIISDGCVTVRQFIYDPKKKEKPPAGFEDLVQGAQTAPGLLGLPLPEKPAPCINWDTLVNTILLCRHDDQAVGKLVVT
ncbi:hypothetical protein V8J88_20335 [Massilia sp. W12]|uniref:hypothetical protein n=1 Tax=Massilia sp. W12 TaxID=3126507 RepID=UPI0030D3AB58